MDKPLLAAPAKELQQYCLYFVLASILLGFAFAFFRFAFKLRFKSHGIARKLVSFCWMLFVAAPALLLLFIHIGAAALALAESWVFQDAFEYLLCNLVAIGPMVNKVPSSTAGKIYDCIISIGMFVITSTILGMTASMGVVLEVEQQFPRNIFGFALEVVVIVVCLMILCFIFGCVLVFVGQEKDMGIVDGFYFMVGLICGLADPLTKKIPVTDLGNFIAALCASIEVALGGAIIGIVSMHPYVQWVITKLDGKPNEPNVQSQDERIAELEQMLSEERASKRQLQSGLPTNLSGAIGSQTDLRSRVAELELLLSTEQAMNQKLRSNLPSPASQLIQSQAIATWEARIAELELLLLNEQKVCQQLRGCVAMYASEAAAREGSLQEIDMPAKSDWPVEI